MVAIEVKEYLVTDRTHTRARARGRATDWIAVLDRFSVFFTTSDHQFGFKKNSSCRHAVYCVRNVAGSYGSTVSMCALDLRKAFDPINHHALFIIKLMEGKFASKLLSILETWFRLSVSCDRQTNRQTDTLIAILRNPKGAK